jgi:hypothetical protein
MFYADVENNTAGSKATLDCSVILSELGFANYDIPVYLSKGTLTNVTSLISGMLKLFTRLQEHSTIVIQYPVLGIHRYLGFMLRLVRIRKSKVICIVHDLDSLRNDKPKWPLSDEIGRLNNFDVVLCHNPRMKAMLLAKGLTTTTHCLGLFDYLLEDKLTTQLKARHLTSPKSRVAFAGNLGKSAFLKNLGLVTGTTFRLYGPGYNLGNAADHVEWLGSYTAEELPVRIDADFGLIWDGDSIEVCNGHLGNYLKFNNPHKASLYLVAKLPLIGPKDSAIGDFIEEHGVGITISSLLQLKDIFNGLTEEYYAEMKSNVEQISAKVSSGAYLKAAMNCILNQNVEQLTSILPSLEK